MYKGFLFVFNPKHKCTEFRVTCTWSTRVPSDDGATQQTELPAMWERSEPTTTSPPQLTTYPSHALLLITKQQVSITLRTRLTSPEWNVLRTLITRVVKTDL